MELPMKPKLLAIASDGGKLVKSLESKDWEIRSVSSLEEANREIVESPLYDLVLIEVDNLADSMWQDALQMMAASPTPCQAVVCCRNGEEDQWTKVLGAGAFDLITEPYSKQEVLRIVGQALTDQSLHRLSHLKAS
jgi:DNA-binding NtrC family response regulator